MKFTINKNITFYLSLVLLIFSSLINPNYTKSVDKDIIQSIENQTNLPVGLSSHQSISYQNSVYLFGGGGDGTSTSAIYRSNLNNIGNITNWEKIGDLPIPLIWHVVVNDNNRVYLLGGTKLIPSAANPTSVDDVYFTTINDDKSISSWQRLPSLPKRLSIGAARIINGRLYYFGGITRTPSGNNNIQTFESNVYMAELLPNGTFTAWIATNTLPQGRAAFAIFSKGNDIYIVGGTTSISLATSDILHTVVSADGQINGWSKIGDFPVTLHRPGFVQNVNKFYIIGGLVNSNTISNKIYLSDVISATSLTWILSLQTLPLNFCCSASVSISNSLYSIGGFNSPNSYLYNVYRIKLAEESLIVPDIKQYSEPWGSQEYDFATRWSLNPTISHWGCALTSASMVLKYYGFDQTPETLNNWLKSQPDGYVRDGILNWLAISRFTKLNSTETAPILEYRRLSNDDSLLSTEIEQKRPAILNVPNHFVVAKGKEDGDFFINDPATLFTRLSAYPGYSSIHRYKPTHTDLSYLMMLINNDSSISLFDSLGNKVSTNNFNQDPLSDDLNNLVFSGEGFKEYLLPVPLDNSYTLKVKSDNIYKLDFYHYDNYGNPTIFSSKGVLDTFYTIRIGEIVTLHKNINIYQLVPELDALYSLKQIQKDSLYKVWRLQIQNAERLFGDGNLTPVKAMLQNILSSIYRSTNDHVSQEAREILTTDLGQVISELQ